jgi:hypothetical protein
VENEFPYRNFDILLEEEVHAVHEENEEEILVVIHWDHIVLVFHIDIDLFALI